MYAGIAYSLVCIAEIVEKRNAESLVVYKRRQKIVLSMSVKQMQDGYEVAVKTE